MTREEAIKILKGGNNHECTWPEYCEAYNMAIKALEQEPILDKIRAEIEQRPYGVASTSVIVGMKYERAAILDILDKYKAESEDKE